VKRPKNIVTSECRCCRRPGWTREVGYQLRSKDEWGKGWELAISAFPDLPADYEPLVACAGGTISQAIEEAVEYCKRAKVRGVGFVFNQRLVLVTAHSNVEKVYRDWWQKVYHETPEQSLAKR
jgi:hypothetical protein